MYEPGPETDKLKDAFAAAYLRNPTDSYAAARVIESNYGKAAWISLNWVFDEYVIAKMSTMQQSVGVASMLPTKEEFALQVLTASTDVADKADKLKYLDLFAKVMGYVDKPGAGGNIGNLTINQNRVMTKVIYESPDAWERAATAKQAALIEHASI